jgi:glycine/D-amino acid oxidase-like deaminating enzyme
MTEALVSLWEATAIPPPPTGPLPGDIEVDLVIVGAGFTGLSAALHAAQNSMRVAVLEQSDVGFGASGRNGGQVNPGIKLDPPDILTHYGKEAGERIIELSGAAPDYLFELVARHGIDCQPVRGGWLLSAHKPAALAGLEVKARSWRARGVPLQMLDRNGVAQLLGTAQFPGGMLDPRGGAVQPLSLARGLASAAISAGVSVYTKTKAVSLARHGAFWHVKTDRGLVKARKIIVGTDGYTDKLVPRLNRSVIVANSLQLATEDLPPGLAETILPTDATASETRRIVIYFRRFGQKFVLGGRGDSGPITHRGQFEHLRKTALSLYPQLQEVNFKYHWAGQVGMTLDALPHLHEPEPGLLVAVGYNGRGVALSISLGRELAQHAAESTNALSFPIAPIKTIPFHGLQNFYVAAGVAAYKLLDNL